MGTRGDSIGVGALDRLGLPAGARLGLGLGPAREDGRPRLLGSCSLSLSKEKKQNRDRKEKKEGLGEEVGHGDNFSGLAKNEFVPRKNRKAMIERLNSNSFDLNSNDLNRK